MGLFEHFPYSNFHDLNLNWIIGKIKNIEQITADVAEQSAAAVQSAADAAESAEQAAGSAEAAAGSAQEAADTVGPFTSTVTEIRARMNAFVQQHSGPADETVLYSSETPVFSGIITPSEAFAGYQNIKFVWQHRGDICEQEFKLTGASGQNFHLRDCFGYYGANNTAGWEMCQMQLLMQQTGELQFTAATVIDNLQYNDGPVDNTMNTGILQVIGIRNVADTEVVDARVAPDGTIYPTLEERLNAMEAGDGLTEEIKQALLNCFNYVAWKNNDPNAQQYIDALENALYPIVAPVIHNLNYAFDDITLTDGYINDSGDIASMSDNKVYNEFVEAVGFCLVTSNGSVYTTGANASLRLAEYDQSDGFLGRSYAQAANKIIGTHSPKYIKMGFSYAATTLANADRFVGLNVLDTTLCTIPNMNIDADGNEVAMSDVSLSDYLPINNDGYMVAYVQNGHDTEVIAFFDENRSIISRHAVVSGGQSTPLITAIAIPSNAAYVRFRCTTTPNATEYISYVG